MPATPSSFSSRDPQYQYAEASSLEMQRRIPAFQATRQNILHDTDGYPTSTLKLAIYKQNRNKNSQIFVTNSIGGTTMNVRPLLTAGIFFIAATALAAEGSFDRTLNVGSSPNVSVATGSGYIRLKPGSDNQVHIV